MAAPTSRPKRRWGRKLLLLLLGLVGLIALLLAVLPYVLSLDSIKEQIITQAESALNNRKVDLGKVRLQLLSGIGAGLEQLAISNPAGWQQSHVVKVDTLSVKVAFWPLLQGKIEVSKIILSDGQINVERNAKGDMNYGDLVASTSPQDAQQDDEQVAPNPQDTETPGPTPPGESSPLANLRISKVVLQNVDIAFIDQFVIPGKTHTTTANKVQVDLSNIGLETPMDFDIAVTLFTHDKHNVHLKGSVGPLPASLAMDQVPLRVATQVDHLQLAPLAPYMGPEPAIESGELNVDLTVQGSLGSAIDIDGSVSLDKVVLPDKTGAGNPTILPKVTLTQDATIKLAEAIAELTEARLDVAGLQAALKGRVEQFNTNPTLDLQLNTTTVNLSDMLSQLPMLAEALPQPSSAQGNLQLRATVKGELDTLQARSHVKADTLSLKSGTFHGAKSGDGMSVDLANMETNVQARLASPQPPHIQLDFKAKHFVFDQQSAAAASPDKPAQSPGSSGPSPLVSSESTAPNVTGKVTIAKGRVKTFPFQNLVADFSLFKGLLKSTQSLQTFGGTIQGQAQANLAETKPDYDLNMQLANINAGHMVNEVTSVPNILFGLLNTNMRFSGKGFDWESLSTTLTGKGKLRLTELKITSLEVMPKLATALQSVSSVAGFTIPTDLATRSFDALKASLRLQEGKLHSDDLQFLGPDIEMLGTGVLGLDQSLQFDGAALLLGQLASAFGNKAAFLHDQEGRIRLPLAIKGTVTKPQITLHETGLMDLARKSLRGKAEKVATQELGKLLNQAWPGSTPDAGQTSEQVDQPADTPIKQLEKGLKRLFNR